MGQAIKVYCSSRWQPSFPDLRINFPMAHHATPCAPHACIHLWRCSTHSSGAALALKPALQVPCTHDRGPPAGRYSGGVGEQGVQAHVVLGACTSAGMHPVSTPRAPGQPCMSMQGCEPGHAGCAGGARLTVHPCHPHLPNPAHASTVPCASTKHTAHHYITVWDGGSPSPQFLGWVVAAQLDHCLVCLQEGVHILPH